MTNLFAAARRLERGEQGTPFTQLLLLATDIRMGALVAGCEGSMIEAIWQACADPHRLLELVRDKASHVERLS